MDYIKFNIPAELKKEFQITVIQNDKDMTAVLIGLIKEYLNNERKAI